MKVLLHLDKKLLGEAFESVSECKMGGGWVVTFHILTPSMFTPPSFLFGQEIFSQLSCQNRNILSVSWANRLLQRAAQVTLILRCTNPLFLRNYVGDQISSGLGFCGVATLRRLVTVKVCQNSKEGVSYTIALRVQSHGRGISFNLQKQRGGIRSRIQKNNCNT